jgi:HK97 gp10 family phage protein
MEIKMDFKGLEELTKAMEKLASDAEIKEVNRRVVKQSQELVKKSLSEHMPRSKDIAKSGRGWGKQTSVSKHAADDIPTSGITYSGTTAKAKVGWNQGDKGTHFYVSFVNWGTVDQPPQNFILKTHKDTDDELVKIAEKEYQNFLNQTIK